MGIIFYSYSECLKFENERKEKENNHFKIIKNGLDTSMRDMKQSLSKIKDWEELMNLKEDEEESPKIKEFTKTKTLKKD